MHIPDGFLSIPVAATGWALSAGAVIPAVHRTGKELAEKQVPLVGVMAAFVFAAQMLNFPVAGGTSGHLIGGALAAILLGPWAGTLVMTAVLAVQALLFQDGGLLALGANVLNMAIFSSWVGYGVYTGLSRLLNGRHWKGSLAGFLAAWSAVVIASIACSLELWLSGTVALSIVLPAMVSVHMVIGIGEGLITTATLAFIAATRRDLLPTEVALERGEP